MLSKLKVADYIWSITADSQDEIAKAFVRFQEYYENPALRGNKSISVHAVESWWKATRSGSHAKDSYYEAWCGFNIPGRIILETMTSSTFRPMWSLKDIWQRRFWKEEDSLLDIIADLSPEEIGASYFIGTSGTSDDVLDHEIAHGFFSTNNTYKSSQLRNIARLPKDLYKQLRDDLIAMGYHPFVIHDEIQAYLSTYATSLGEVFGCDIYDEYTDAFEKTFESYRSPRSLMDEHLASNEEGTGSSPVEGTKPIAINTSKHKCIRVNGDFTHTDDDAWTYEHILKLKGYAPERILSVVLSYPLNSSNIDRSLIIGESAELVDNMSIDLADTSNA